MPRSMLCYRKNKHVKPHQILTALCREVHFGFNYEAHALSEDSFSRAARSNFLFCFSTSMSRLCSFTSCARLCRITSFSAADASSRSILFSSLRKRFSCFSRFSCFFSSAISSGVRFSHCLSEYEIRSLPADLADRRAGPSDENLRLLYFRAVFVAECPISLEIAPLARAAEGSTTATEEDEVVNVVEVTEEDKSLEDNEAHPFAVKLSDVVESAKPSSARNWVFRAMRSRRNRSYSDSSTGACCDAAGCPPAALTSSLRGLPRPRRPAGLPAGGLPSAGN